MNVMNTVRPVSPKIPDKKSLLLLPLLRQQLLLSFPCCFYFGLSHLHRSTCEYFGVVAHVRGGEGLPYKVGDPITDLTVTRRNEAALFSVQGVVDR